MDESTPESRYTSVAGRAALEKCNHGALTATGAWLYLLARAAYLPLYLSGVRRLRTVAWAVSLVGPGAAADRPVRLGKR